jgi:LuxR family transcriptional regulator, maltose regulon positive regulatory protein
MGPIPTDGATRLGTRRVPASTVVRPRLDRTLDRIPPGGIGLVVAPAGSGKSVLLGQWMRGSAARACHLQITPADDDPVVFARALTSAIAAVAPDFDPRVADLVAVAGPDMGTVFVSRLLVGLEELDVDVVIVLDDVHRLANRAIWADLDQVIERLPDNVRIVLSARWDPPVRLQSLQLLSQVVEVRASDLAFAADEARGLIEAVSGHPLTELQTDALVDRTDGWAAGLQLAAISLQRFADADAFIDGFTGSNKLVADYLAEEVIDVLEPEVRRFLLHTSVLEWLSADVCNVVTGGRDAEEMLDLLARRSLFLVQPDRSGERLRYHHLFADLLRDRLRASEPDEEPRLRRRAAAYLLGHGQLADAIEQLLVAGDGSQVVRVIVDRGQGFFEREENLTLARWLTTARAQNVDAPVALEVNLLAAQLAGHDTGAAVETYRRLRRRTDLAAGETAAAAALYTCLVLNDLPTSEVHRAAREAVDLLGSSEVVTDFLGIGGRDSVEFLAATMSAMARLHDGELADSARAFEATLELPAAQYRLWKVFALGAYALALALAGRSTKARAHASTALAFAEANGVAHHHGLAYSHFALARVSLDQRDRSAATFHLHESETRVRRSGRAALRSVQELLRIEHLATSLGSQRTLGDLRSSAPVPVGPTLFAELRRAQELQLLVRSGKLGQARALVETSPQTSRLLPALIDLELASGDVVAARRALDRWGHRPELRGQVERLVGTAAVLSAEGRPQAAHRALQEALDRAEPELLRQPFLTQPAALRILHDRAPRGSQAFARSILGAAAAEARGDGRSALVEPLTDREREILDYLPTRLSNTDIASHLYVSVNTLKSHLRHIYTKLAAANRDEAVARATDLGLL